jgi:heme exporter protein B
MQRAFWAIIMRDMKLAVRAGGSGLMNLIFFLMIISIMPFALGPDLKLLSQIGPALLWVATLLASLIGLDRIFQSDEEDGGLDVMRSSILPIEGVVLAKTIAHWLTTGMPLTLCAPLLGLLLAVSFEVMQTVTLTLLIGTPAFSFIGAIGAALTASIRRGGLLLALLVMPFMIPTLIFGVSASQALETSFRAPFLILGALSLFFAVIGVFGAAAALKHSE